MRALRQVAAVMALTPRTIPARLSSSAVAITGIAGVVIVFVSLLSIGAGFAAAMQGSGSPARALILRSGADTELTSGLDGPEVDVIKQAPGIRRDASGPRASAGLYAMLDIPKRPTPDLRPNVPIRALYP